MVRLIPLFLDNDMIIIRPVHVTITQSGRTVVRTCAQISYSQCMNPRNVPVACPSGELSVQGRSPPHNGPECCSPDTLRPTLNRPFLGSRVVYEGHRGKRLDVIIKAHQRGIRTGEATCITPEILYSVHERVWTMKQRFPPFQTLKIGADDYIYECVILRRERLLTLKYFTVHIQKKKSAKLVLLPFLTITSAERCALHKGQSGGHNSVLN
ncbi:hypothetical protein F5141DRAFT_443458 [Pisolithus sp. B1]|nr:hypothetical protein F5141DRAFT_443458 [Pisolithus sp. B1]